MQVIDVEDFEKDSILVISKVEIDKDGEGTFQELPDVKSYNISTNEENRVAKFCSYSFNITCLNTADRYNPLNSGSDCPGWLKQGRRIKLYAGISGKDSFQLILGRIDNFKLSKKAGQDICTITGRCLMRMVLDFKLYSPYTYWGTNISYDTEVNKIRYNMEPDCKGIYRVELDYTNKDGTALEEIFENTDWSYDWHNNQLVFTPKRIPDSLGTKNLKVYYFQEQSVDGVVADILIGSGILQAKIEATTISFSNNDPNPDTILDSNNNFVTAGFRSGQIIKVVTSGTNNGIYTISNVTPGVITLIDEDSLTTEDATIAGTVTITTDVNLVSKTEWLESSSVDPTVKTIHRVWFTAGTSALKAITLLAEVVQYRFYFDYEGKSIFKRKPSADPPVNTISHYESKIQNVEEDVDETYTHVIVIGEERDRIIGEDEIAPGVPSGLTLSTGMGEASLAWIKAEWEANTESDFGHYKLRIRKIGYSYTEISTIATSFTWVGLDLGVTYGVQIRAVDIYNNWSDWSSEVTIPTATGDTTPAQITGAVATALLAGIKITWEGATGGLDIAGYIIERQESENGVPPWTGEWTEIVRTDATMWLDLLLTYAIHYRYRVKAYTQTGVEGPASDPTGDSVKPIQAGSDDIIFGAITGDQIAANTIMANNYKELRNTYVQQGQDSLDATHSFELDFEIVSEMTAINNIKLSFRIRKFRAYSKGAASGGGATSGSGGGQTSSSVSHTHSGQTTGSGGLHMHIYGWQDADTTSTLGHWHGYRQFSGLFSAGSHSHPLNISSSGSHSHYVYAHTHYVYAHTHNLVFGIYEETQYPTINVFIDNGAGYGASIGAYTTDQLDINITGYISGIGFKRIKFTSNKRTRISAWVLTKLDLTA